jgi:hypothetical protein
VSSAALFVWIERMSPTTTTVAAAAAGGLTVAFSKLKAMLNRIWSIGIVDVNLEGTIAQAVKSYCWTNMAKSPFGSKRYISGRYWVRPVNKQMEVVFEGIGTDPTCFWKGWRPFFVGAVAEIMQSGTAGNNIIDGRLSLSFIRGTFDLDDLLTASLDEYNSRFGDNDHNKNKLVRFQIRRFVGKGAAGRNSRQNGDEPTSGSISSEKQQQMFIDTGEYRSLRWQTTELGAELTVGRKALDGLSLPIDALEAVEEAKHWLSSEQWYRDRQLPWTRGWLLYGPPGTGKSTFIRSVAEDLNLPVYVFDLSSMSNYEFEGHWSEMKSNAPCIAAFEDVDAVFEGRKNVTGELGGGLTFDCFLNALSGIGGANGILKILTTNRVEILDDALGVPRKDVNGISLSTRPGRADRAIELAHPDENGRRKIAIRILSDCLDHVDRLVVEGENDTGAQFADRCARLALKEFWASREGKPCEIFSDNGRSLTRPLVPPHRRHWDG